MKLLKIGSLNMPNNRWEDALNYFDEVYVFSFDTEKDVPNASFHYLKFDTKDNFNNFWYRFVRHFSYSKRNHWLCYIGRLILRVYNHSLLETIKGTEYTHIHSSYNDFDDSAFLTFLLSPKTYTRAQKETRLYYSFIEKQALAKASRVILNDKLNVDFFQKKYDANLFDGKEVLTGLDEDVRSARVLTKIRYKKKLSEADGKIHAVILAGRALSTSSDKRSGGRLYYIPLINKLLDAGMVVHLHTGNIVPFVGHNPYEELAAENTNFKIEDKLDFMNEPEIAYGTLSRYDIGICHAHIPNSEVTEFDKVNLPHRYYEYELAHVVPIDVNGGNYLLEKKAAEGHALIYETFNDVKLSDCKNIKWDTPTFADYIQRLYCV